MLYSLNLSFIKTLLQTNLLARINPFREPTGILEKVRYSEWAALIVPVVKPGKSMRICGDYKVTLVNSVLEVDQHPFPNPEQLFVELSEGDKFTKLDLSH